MNVGVHDLSKKSYLRKIALFKKFKSLRSHNKKMKRLERKVRLIFSKFCFILSDKSILVAHIFTLWSKIGKRKIIDQFFWLINDQVYHSIIKV